MLIVLPSSVPINPGFIFFISEVFVIQCGVVFVRLLNGTDSAENGEFI